LAPNNLLGAVSRFSRHPSAAVGLAAVYLASWTDVLMTSHVIKLI
jgi:hypothetical protein